MVLDSQLSTLHSPLIKERIFVTRQKPQASSKIPADSKHPGQARLGLDGRQARAGRAPG